MLNDAEQPDNTGTDEPPPVEAWEGQERWSLLRVGTIVLTLIGAVMAFGDESPRALGWVVLVLAVAGWIGTTRVIRARRPRGQRQDPLAHLPPAQRRIKRTGLIIGMLSAFAFVPLAFAAEFGEGDPGRVTPWLTLAAVGYLVGLAAMRWLAPERAPMQSHEVHDGRRLTTKVLLGILAALVLFIGAAIVADAMGWVEPRPADDLSWGPPAA